MSLKCQIVDLKAGGGVGHFNADGKKSSICKLGSVYPAGFNGTVPGHKLMG